MSDRDVSWLEEALDNWDWGDFGYEDTEAMNALQDIINGKNSEEKPEGVIEFDPATQERPTDIYDEIMAQQQQERNQVRQADTAVKEEPQGEGFPITNYPEVDEDVKQAILNNTEDVDTLGALLGVQILRDQKKIMETQETNQKLLIKLIEIMVSKGQSPEPAKKPNISFGS